MTDKKKFCMAIVAHVDSGKTTLSEAMLYESGNIRKIGRVDHQDAFLDTYALEKSRGITIFSKQAMLELEHTKVTLLDTPGHVDFSAEMERTLQVLDYAILVVSGADGVQGHTRTLWNLLKQYEIPTFLFINKMDQNGTNQNEIMEELKVGLDEGCVDFSFKDKASFEEAIAMCDEQVLEDYFETGEIKNDTICDLIQERKLFPCFFGSALKLDGVKEFLEGLKQYTKRRIYPDVFGGRVFKIARDRDGKRLSYIKITGGCLKAKDVVQGIDVSGQAWEEKVHELRIYSGEKYETISEAVAGEVCAVTGLTKTYPGQGIGFENEGKKPVLEPVLTYEIQLPEETDPAVMLPKLQELEEEEPELHIVWNENLQEIHAQLMGEVQMEILKHLIEERFGVAVSFGQGNIVYKETIGNIVEGVGHFEPLRHYAEVHLLMEPLERGSGLEFAMDCSEDVLDKNWQRLILTHLLEKEHKGVLTGSPITDIKMSIVAGKAHQKHTEGGDFRQATYRAIRQGLMEADSILLEPFYRFRLEIPEQMVGRAMTDIEKMHGTFELPEQAGELTLIGGRGPVATMRDYQKEVVAYTKGFGKISFQMDGYDVCHNAEEVIEEIGYHADEDTKNPSTSVFCSHGSGYYVPWNEVKEHMHVASVLSKEAEEEEINEPVNRISVEEEWMDVDEVDRILQQTYYANQGKKTNTKRHNMQKRRDMVYTGLSKPRKIEKKDKYLLVDGYNIIFAWEELSELAKKNLDSARGRLLDILADYQGMKHMELIAVFDAYRLEGHPTEILDYHNIHVVYTKEAETADQYIEKFAHSHSKKYDITVATSDGLEQIIIRGEGCRLISAREFEQEIKREKELFRENYLNETKQITHNLSSKIKGLEKE
ncbi:MAG: TetM/TetW/TetO/TetS family tetracycline resistance ribosomal protection protein [Anaerostipes sp.]|nr:TetM/TetW/TetO/TetS family tetracycline resistance ribosomal protection protein [Anaerostipes sp.]